MLIVGGMLTQVPGSGNTGLMVSTLALLFATTVAAPAAAPAPAQVPAVLRACGDRSQFPPYTFVAAGSQGATGYNVDFLAELLAAEDRQIRIELLPWKRCLALVAKGDFDIVLDIGGTPARSKDFHLVRSHYTVTPVIVYSLERPVAAVRRKEELAGIKRCEMLGWDYSATGLPQVPDELVSRPATIESAFAMLRAGRCQAMVYDVELVQGLEAHYGKSWMAGLGYHVLPWVPTYQMHLGISRQVPHAASLQRMLDAGVERLQRSGQATRLLERYLPR